MRRSRWLIAWIVADLLVIVGDSRIFAEPPATGPSAPPERPMSATWPDEVIILNGAADLDDFWTRLARPDLIVTRPGATETSPRINGPTSSARTRAHAVNALKVRGRVTDDLASLSLELDLSLLVPGPLWVPLGIDGPVISSAREGDRELELRRMTSGTWEVRIEGNGLHRIHCEVKVPVKISPDRKLLEMSIPEAPSTYLEIDVPQQVFEVDLGAGEAISKTSLGDGKGTRLSAHLSPRSRLTLGWTDEGSSRSGATPFLAARIEIAIEADAEWITTLSSWEIRCIRGVARTLEIRLDEPDIVRMIKLDDQLLVERIERNVLTIPLGEPLRTNGIRRLTLQTRRAIPSGSPGRFDFAGFSLANAVEQSGAIGVSPAANVWVDANVTRGLRRIDPGELPRELRARPGISLAYQFLDQPFRLGLEIEESPPLFRTETSSNIFLDGDLARTETSLKIQRVRGRLFELEIESPPGLELAGVEPSEIVESIIPASETNQTSGDRQAQAVPQVARLRLSVAARNQRSFSVRLVGRQRVASGGPVKLAVFASRGGVPVENTVTLLGGRDLTFESPEDAGASGRHASSTEAFQPQPLPEHTATGRGDRLPIAVLKSQGNPTLVQGILVRHPRTLWSSTNVEAQITTQGVEVNQETKLRVRHGLISTLPIRVPLGQAETWQVFQGEVNLRPEELPGDDGASRRYRLKFDPPVPDITTLVFRFRIPLIQGQGTAFKASVPWVVIEESTGRLDTVTLVTSPGLRTTVDDPHWTVADDHRERPDGGGARCVYRPVDSSEPLRLERLPVTVRAMERVALPQVVVPRALLRTVVGVDRQARTRVWYWVESHGPDLALRLPAGSRWVRASTDGRAAEQIEPGSSGSGYRIVLPKESRSKPVLVELEYQSTAEDGRVSIDAPRLEEGAVVMQAFWIVQVPWSDAVVGVPRDWMDENEWYWDAYLWKRRPWRSLSRLMSWVSGSPAASEIEDLPAEAPEDAHAYLFGRAGEPGVLPLTVASRAWLVAIFSGTVLLSGFLVMVFHVRFRVIWLVGAILGMFCAAFAHPSVVLLVLQSSLFGVVLTLLGLVTQRLVERARGASPPAVAPAPSGLSAAVAGPSGVGSDDSTAVRVRVTASSTMDHVAAPLILPTQQPEPAASSRVGPAV